MELTAAGRITIVIDGDIIHVQVVNSRSVPMSTMCVAHSCGIEPDICFDGTGIMRIDGRYWTAVIKARRPLRLRIRLRIIVTDACVRMFC